MSSQTAATIEPGAIVCPNCSVHGSVMRYGAKCPLCNDDGTIPDPRCVVYYGSDPAAFVAQCCVRPRDDERLRVWAEACNHLWQERSGGITLSAASQQRQTEIDYWTDEYATSFSADKGNFVFNREICSFGRSLFPPPWLCELPCDNPECEGGKVTRDNNGNVWQSDCDDCHGSGFRSMMDRRWRDSTVLMVAQGIRGNKCRSCRGKGSTNRFDKSGDIHVLSVCSKCKGTRNGPPDFTRMPILADALMDAGADNEAMIRHARENGAYVVGDWLLSLILGE